MNVNAVADVIKRWHSHDGIDEQANRELSKLSWAAHYSALTYGSTPTAAICIKVAIETAFQLGRRHPLSTFEWQLLEAPNDTE
jgi:hypothetical protein